MTNTEKGTKDKNVIDGLGWCQKIFDLHHVHLMIPFQCLP